MNELKILAMSRGLAQHAEARQSLIAGNVANADTVGYRARDVKPFAEVYLGPGGPDRAREADMFSPAATRPGHPGYRAQAERPLVNVTPVAAARRGAESPNGNSVSVEDQMIRGAEAKISHDMALGVMRKAMDLLRMSIGRK